MPDVVVLTHAKEEGEKVGCVVRKDRA